jgi:hypothetical protein
MKTSPMIDPLCLPREGWEQWKIRLTDLLRDLIPEKLNYPDGRVLKIGIQEVTGWESDTGKTKRQRVNVNIKLSEESKEEEEKTVQLLFDFPFRRTAWGSFLLNKTEYVVVPQLGFKEGIHIIDQANRVVQTGDSEDEFSIDEEDIEPDKEDNSDRFNRQVWLVLKDGKRIILSKEARKKGEACFIRFGGESFRWDKEKTFSKNIFNDDGKFTPLAQKTWNRLIGKVGHLDSDQESTSRLLWSTDDYIAPHGYKKSSNHFNPEILEYLFVDTWSLSSSRKTDLKQRKLFLFGDLLDIYLRSPAIWENLKLLMFNKWDSQKNLFWELLQGKEIESVGRRWFSPLASVIKEFFVGKNACVSVQLASRTNPLAFLSQLRTITQKDGIYIQDENINQHLRNIDDSWTGLICPVMTPEGATTGLNLHLATYASVNTAGELGLLISKEDEIKERGEFLPVQEESGLHWDEKGKKWSILNNEELYLPTNSIFSIETNLIPALFHNDATRALMGCKYHVQAVPLCNPEKPYFISGFEDLSDYSGQTLQPDFQTIWTECVNSEPKWIRPSEFKPMEFSLGINARVAYMPWWGYNYEDGIVISDHFAKKLSSYYTETVRYELKDVSDSNSSYYVQERLSLPKLKDRAEVNIGDVIGTIERTWSLDSISKEEKLKKALLGNPKTPPPKDILSPINGILILVPNSKDKKLIWRIVGKRQAKVGDKLSGRHGNKGVIVKIEPKTKMPRLARDPSKSIDVILNPLGVISRMNMGQLYEVQQTWKAYCEENLDEPVRHDPLCDLDWSKYQEKLIIPELGSDNSILADHLPTEMISDPKDPSKDWETTLPVTVGFQYIYLLNHHAEKKEHARILNDIFQRRYTSQGQPPSGKANNGGQRLGEMELWALLAHNSWHTIQSLYEKESDFFKNDLGFTQDLGLENPLNEMSISFINVLRAMGIGMKFSGLNGTENNVALTPLTDFEAKQLVLNSRSGYWQYLIEELFTILKRFSHRTPDSELSDGKLNIIYAQFLESGSLVDAIPFPPLDARSRNPDLDEQLNKILQCFPIEWRTGVISYIDKKGNTHKLAPNKSFWPENTREINFNFNLDGKQLLKEELGFEDVKYWFECRRHASFERGSKPEAHGIYSYEIFGGDFHGSLNHGFRRRLWGWIAMPKGYRYLMPHSPMQEKSELWVGTKSDSKEKYEHGLSIIPVLPIQIRNPFGFRGEMRPDEISKAYKRIRRAIEGINAKDEDSITNDLKYALTNLYTKLIDRLKSKEGIIRQYVLGKRIDHSGRAVITGDPSLQIDEIILPQVLWERLECTDGDFVIFGRQPTLHKLSILAAKPKPSKTPDDHTIHIPSLLTTAFNADFDGDTMWVIKPEQTTEVQEELVRMLPSNQLSSPTTGKFSFPFSQDFVLGLSFLSCFQPTTEKEPFAKWISEAFKKYTVKALVEPVLTDQLLEKSEIAVKCKEYIDSEEAKTELLKIQTISAAAITLAGISVSLNDFMLDKQSLQPINDFGNAIQNVRSLLEIKAKNKWNNVALMLLSGARGNNAQLAQICLRRGPMLMIGESTESSHTNDLASNLVSGMTAEDYFQSCYGQRIGLVSTAFATAECGHLTRKMIFATQHNGIEGIIASHAVGERVTQSALSAFHSGGVFLKNTDTRKFKKVQQLLNWTKEFEDGSKSFYDYTKTEFLKELGKLLGEDLRPNHIELLWDSINGARNNLGKASISIAANNSPTLAVLGFENIKRSIIGIIKNDREIKLSDPLSKVMLNQWN